MMMTTMMTLNGGYTDTVQSRQGPPTAELLPLCTDVALLTRQSVDRLECFRCWSSAAEWPQHSPACTAHTVGQLRSRPTSASDTLGTELENVEYAGKVRWGEVRGSRQLQGSGGLGGWTTPLHIWNRSVNRTSISCELFIVILSGTPHLALCLPLQTSERLGWHLTKLHTSIDPRSSGNDIQDNIHKCIFYMVDKNCKQMAHVA